MKNLVNKSISLCLIILMLLFSMSSFMYESEATTNNVKYDRAPRISVDRSNKNKLIFKIRDKANVEAIELSKYNKNKKSYNKINLKANNIKIGAYNKKTDVRKVEFPADFFEVNEKTGIKISAIDKNGKKTKISATYVVKKLEESTINGNWFLVNVPAQIKFEKITRKPNLKTLPLKITDKSELETLVVKDVNNNNKEIFNKNYSTKHIKEVTVKLNLSKAKTSIKGYVLKFIIKSYGTTRIETVYISNGVDWGSLGYEYNKNGVICPRYFQSDIKWTNMRYTAGGYGKTIGTGGCGACALAMAVSGLTQKVVTPIEIVSYLNKINVNTIYNSTLASQKVASKYGLTYEHIDRTNKSKINQALDQGKCLIFSIRANGIYTGNGHFIMCPGRVGDKYYVLESSGFNYYKTNQAYSFNQVFTPGVSGVFVLGKK